MPVSETLQLSPLSSDHATSPLLAWPPRDPLPLDPTATRRPSERIVTASIAAGSLGPGDADGRGSAQPMAATALRTAATANVACLTDAPSSSIPRAQPQRLRTPTHGGACHGHFAVRVPPLSACNDQGSAGFCVDLDCHDRPSWLDEDNCPDQGLRTVVIEIDGQLG